MTRLVPRHGGGRPLPIHFYSKPEKQPNQEAIEILFEKNIYPFNLAVADIKSVLGENLRGGKLFFDLGTGKKINYNGIPAYSPKNH